MVVGFVTTESVKNQQMASSTDEETGGKLPFAVGDTVVVDHNRCIVRYIGRIHRRKRLTRSVYVGVAFDEPIGNTSGTLEGNTYFKCPPRHGLFVLPALVHTLDSPMQMEEVEEEDTERTKDVGGDRAAFGVWNLLDQLGEQEALSASREMLLMDKEMVRQTSMEDLELEPERPSTWLGGRRKSSLTLSALAEEAIPDSYEGPRLDREPDMAFALELLESYRTNPGRRLHVRYVVSILMRIEKLLRKSIKRSVFEVDAPKSEAHRLVLVGDTHGQLNDVLWIFFKFGLPDPENPYIFNGDVADRGHYAVEIFLLLFAFKLARPSCMHINRGNHESVHMNEIYGFALEVRQKYGRAVYLKFQDIFNLLPLCIVVDRRVVVVHGGLFRADGVTLDDINRLDRVRPCPTSPETDHECLMFDILWSDPQHNEGRGPSGRGQDCIAFGPDVTEDFLTTNQLDLCIRSHQVPRSLRGFDTVHGGKCITLFSASNYCGTSGNLGAVLIFDSNLAFEIHEYMAPSLEDVHSVYHETKWATEKVKRFAVAVAPPEVQDLVNRVESRTKIRTRRLSVMNIERDLVAQMSKIICEKRAEIWDMFWHIDAERTGTVPMEAIAAGFLDMLKHELPWRMLIQKLEFLNTDTDTVDYNGFLQVFRVEFRPKQARHANWRLETVLQVFEAMMKADLTLRETLLVFDRNADGTVSYREFEELLGELKCGLSGPQVRLLMRIITAHYLTRGGSRVDVGEFLGRFKVVYDRALAVSRPRAEKPIVEDWIPGALQLIGRHILADKIDAAERYYSGHMFLSFMEPSKEGLGPTERRRSSALRSVALLQKFADYLRDEAQTAQTTFVEDEAEGYLSYDGFVRAIRRLPVASMEKELGTELDTQRLLQLAEAIDIARSGRINYLEFLNAFHVEDREEKKLDVAEQLWEQICSAFYSQRVAIERALSYLDPEGAGRVTPDDFKSALEALNSVLGSKAPLTAAQVDLVIASIDSESDGFIDYHAFLDAFVVVDVLEGRWPEDPAIEEEPLEKEEAEQATETSRSLRCVDVLETPPPSTADVSGMLLDYLKRRRLSTKVELPVSQ